MRPNPRSTRTSAVRTASETDRGRALVLCVAAWLVPGAGHLLQHRLGRGLTCLFVLPLMFALGLLFDGALFPLTPITQSPLTSAAALAERCVGAPWIATAVAGWGRGDVVSPTYEYGWVLMVVAGLLNTLVVLDAYDIALGRKQDDDPRACVMPSHFFFLLVFSVLVSTVFAVLQKDTLADQVRFALTMTAGFVAFAVAAGWLMRLFPL